MAAVTSIVRNNVLGKLEIEVDGFAVLTLLYEQGNGTLGPLDKFLNERVRVNRRGNHVTTLWGNRVYPTFSFTSFLSEIVGSDNTPPGSLVEALTQLGAYDDGGSLIPPTCTLRWTIFGSVAGLANNEIVEMTDVAATFNVNEAVEGNTVEVEATIEGHVEVTRGGKTITFEEISAA